MIRPTSVLLPALTVAALASLAHAVPVTAQVGVPPQVYASESARYSANQLDNLVGPVALYPDPLLAQVLIASTFPDQVADAARFVRAYGTDGIDEQPWDISVRAVAHYPSALNTMADKGDWTATLGAAYANQSSDVMAAIQRMRTLAAQQGNLLSNEQQQVVVDNNNYVIAPAHPRVIYVPVYDPIVIYTRPIFNPGFSSRYWSFGVGFPIGGWLNYDLDWGLRSVYYNGWNSDYIAYGGGWRVRSRPYVQITNIYVNPRYRTVYYNRDAGRWPINYRNVDRYSGYHRDTYFDNRNKNGRDVGNRDGRNRQDGNRDAGNRNDGNRNDGGYTGRTAQPRASQPRVTPDGYSNGQRPDNRGGNGNGNADTNRGGNAPNGNDRNDRNGGDRSGPVNRSNPRPQVAAPESRRAEPQLRAPQRMTPDVNRGSAPRVERGTIERPQAQPRQAQPEQSPPRQAQPRQAQPRQSPPAEARSREAPPREPKSREAQPRKNPPGDDTRGIGS